MNEEEKKLPPLQETIDELMKKIEELEKEKEEYLANLKRAKNDVLRLQTEYEEKAKIAEEMANANLIYSLLNVLDSFELAFNKYKEEEIEKGFFLIYAQLKDILKKFGLEEMNPLNMKFNPHLHETVKTEFCQKENCSQEDEGLIVEVYSKGYFLKGRLLRPARVKVITH